MLIPSEEFCLLWISKQTSNSAISRLEGATADFLSFLLQRTFLMLAWQFTLFAKCRPPSQGKNVFLKKLSSPRPGAAQSQRRGSGTPKEHMFTGDAESVETSCS